ncbi:MAG: tetratricopeptide repeat protein [bacterium]
MKYLTNFRRNIFLVLTMLFLLFLFVGVGLSQDLNQQKQQKMNQVNEIDSKLKANPSPDEYDRLIKERKKIVAEIEDINKKLMADDAAMKKMAAVKKAFNDGKNAFKLGQYTQALNLLNEAIAMDSTFYLAHYVKGLTLKKSRKFNEAISAYKATIRHNPSYIEAYIALGKLYSLMEMHDNAITTYNDAIAKDPSAYRVYYELGVVYRNNKKNYKKAAENFTKATQINPEYDLAFYSLGVSLTELSRFDEAIMALENALAVTKRKRWADPYYRMAVVYNRQGKFSQAKKAAVDALNIKKNYGAASYEAGIASKNLGQIQTAKKYFEAAKQDRIWKKSAEYEIKLLTENR